MEMVSDYGAEQGKGNAEEEDIEKIQKIQRETTAENGCGMEMIGIRASLTKIGYAMRAFQDVGSSNQTCRRYYWPREVSVPVSATSKYLNPSLSIFAHLRPAALETIVLLHHLSLSLPLLRLVLPATPPSCIALLVIDEMELRAPHAQDLGWSYGISQCRLFGFDAWLNEWSIILLCRFA